MKYIPFGRHAARPARPKRTRRVLAATLAGAVGLVTLTVSTAVAGSWSRGHAHGWSSSQWVGADRAVTVQVGALPQNVAQATFQVTVSRASSPTQVTVCGGTTATAACKNAAPSPAKRATFSRTVDVGTDRQITLYSSTSAAQVTVSLLKYTTSSSSAPSAAAPAQSAVPAPAPATSTAPSISATTATATPSPTTTPSPASTPSSAPVPAPQSQPSGGWPGASNTGVPAGTKLKVLEPGSGAPAGTVWSGNVLKVTTNGTVLDSLEIRGEVRVEAKDVVIKNSLITGQYLASAFSLIYISGPAYSVTVQDSELYAKYPSAWVRGVIGYNFTLLRVNIHDVTDQMAITGDNVLVQDSWLHGSLYYLADPVYGGTPSHDDNAQIQQGSNLRFVHNTMEGTHNAAIQVTQDAGVVGNLHLENNVISDGGCSVNLAQKSYGPLQGFTIQGNVFTRTQGYAGCAIVVDSPSAPLLTLVDNLWSDGAAVQVVAR